MFTSVLSDGATLVASMGLYLILLHFMSDLGMYTSEQKLIKIMSTQSG
jgi:hypothetical protein